MFGKKKNEAAAQQEPELVIGADTSTAVSYTHL